MSENNGFGMPHFPKRTGDVIGQLDDWITAQLILDTWEGTGSSVSEELQRVQADGEQASAIMDSMFSVDNRGEV